MIDLGIRVSNARASTPWPLLTLPLDTVSSPTLPLLTLPLDTVSSPTLLLLTLLLPTLSPSLTPLCLLPILVRKGCGADDQNILNNYLIYLSECLLTDISAQKL